MADRNTSSSAGDDVKKDLDALRRDFEALRKDLGGVVEAVKGNAGDRASSEIEALRKRLDQLGGDLHRSGREGLQAVEEQISERPLVTLAMAFAVGLVLGRLFDRR